MKTPGQFSAKINSGAGPRLPPAGPRSVFGRRDRYGEAAEHPLATERIGEPQCGSGRGCPHSIEGICRWPAPRYRRRPSGARSAMDYKPGRGTGDPPEDIEAGHVSPCRVPAAACSRPPRRMTERQQAKCGRTQFSAIINSHRRCHPRVSGGGCGHVDLRRAGGLRTRPACRGARQPDDYRQRQPYRVDVDAVLSWREEVGITWYSPRRASRPRMAPSRASMVGCAISCCTRRCSRALLIPAGQLPLGLTITMPSGRILPSATQSRLPTRLGSDWPHRE